LSLLTDLSDKTVSSVESDVRRAKRSGDVAVASIHWGGNWGYDIPAEHVRFARALIDRAGVDVVHGHSSHHVRPFELYRGKLILYGCGDFINDYEGIVGNEGYRDDLVLMYFAQVNPTTGKLHSLEMVPLQIRNFRLNRPSRQDAVWLANTLKREGGRFDTGVDLQPDNSLILELSSDFD
jgi:poly-gamma-glutamate synthesis protein (capsule biosynthesis protein)